jgi:hydroxypyruvate reductase
MSLADLLRGAFERALGDVDLERRVAAAMPNIPRIAHAAAVIAVGKAAPAMARGALAAAGARVVRALVVAPDGTEARLDDARVEVLRAAHPDPDGRSVRAALRALEVARDADFLVALISGGASSLLCLPRGVPLMRYVRVVRALLLGGATVREVNVVRRHLCAIKGGGLARAAGGPVVTLVASDVIGGAAHEVGSGPTSADPTTRAHAHAILARYAPRLAMPPLHESLEPGSAVARRLRARLVARPEDLARAMAAELRPTFGRVRVLRPSLASVRELAREYAARARSLRRGEAVVRAAEPVLRVDASRPGRGGRSTHLAALVAPALPAGVAFLAGASDGVDGASETGGAVVDAEVAARLVGASSRVSSRSLARSLAAFDTGALLASAGAALPLRPTGTNLADVHALVRAP